ncbi:azurin [Pseudoxanthomonas koreensis]|uniref:azurin n=1 Tax=Pseudoxanthomonas koreensis TaxID=266061 RepID=UPI0035A58112
MHVKIASLSIACALALTACGGGNDQAPQAVDRDVPASTAAPADTAAAPTAPIAPAAPNDPAAAQVDQAAGADAAAPAGNEAVVSNCSTTIEGDDAMKFNVGSITVPASCSRFTINLVHSGKLPVAAMGHNVVIAAAADRQGIAADGMSSGVDGGYLKADDDRVIAHSEMIGGGQTTSVSFDVSKIKGDGPYEFFCSFPGHWTVMHGPIKVG